MWFTFRTVIILGDFNVSHKPIDHCNPDADDEKFYARPSRHWLGQLLMDTSSTCKSATKQNSQKKPSKFIDTFRYFHPKQEHAFTCWSTVTGARQTNYGTRIDYIVSDVSLCQEEFEDCEIVQDFEGSDHCPVRATLKGTPEPFDKLPSMCTKFMPEFYGRQQKLSTFFTKGLEKEKSAKTERTQAIGSASLGKEKLPSSWKRNLGKSDYEPSFKRTKSDSKNKSHKTVSITNFFKKVPSATQGSSSKETQNLNYMQLQNDTDQIDDITKTIHIGKVPRGDEDKGIDGGKNEGSLGMTGETNSSETNGLVKGTNVRSKTKKQMVSSWKDILKGPRPPPLCKGHKEPCLLRTVKKPGPNLGKQFYVCCRPEGHKSNPEARCNNFEWVVPLKKLKEVKGDEPERETKI
ncbi:putative DNA-(apurinic or apyrimidinic site) lyase 2 isoform X2 [Apostichopus japonicus]|uniref:DNA-(apurinic or apyrimidinic site) endonuclease 2 n=1 Tax=Stichopus japonicus TaxID=307972 RepID=A0A2G8L4S9_STIJA|nr:putative DNA-(apurinic or apyrimidinic site) lyase 2 isoform X2 [Apostichopus japonicus]